jgi:hypothetical protein
MDHIFGKGSETDGMNAPELLYHVYIFWRVRENATGALQTYELIL